MAVNLEGRRLAGLTRISTAVRAAVEEALHRILTPRRSVDVLREVRYFSGRAMTSRAGPRLPRLGGRTCCLLVCPGVPYADMLLQAKVDRDGLIISGRPPHMPEGVTAACGWQLRGLTGLLVCHRDHSSASRLAA